MPVSTHRPKLLAGDYAAALRAQTIQGLTPALRQALAKGPMSLADLAEATGHGFPVVAAAVRSQPKSFFESGGKVRNMP